MISLFNLNPDYTKRVYGLDVYRTIAILIVVFQHGNLLLNNTVPIPPCFAMLDGVGLFFVLSGFLIGGILIKIIERDNGLNFKSLIHFWHRRWYRTLPLYYLILLVNVILVKTRIIGGDIHQFNWKFIFFLQNFNSTFVDFFWESWSLSIEEWFYILFPITLLLLVSVLRKLFSIRNVILIGIIVFIGGSILFRFFKYDSTMDNPFWWECVWKKNVLFRLDSIVYGVLAAFVKQYYNTIWKYKSQLLFYIGLLLALLNLFVFSALTELTSAYRQVFYFSVYSISYLLMIPYADSVTSFKTSFGKIITHISLISYAMYLINLGCVQQVIANNVSLNTTSIAIFTYCIYWFVVVAFSTLLYKYYEKPMTDLRDRV